MLKASILALILSLAALGTGHKVYVETGLMILNHDAYERPYPRKGCRRCSPKSVDIPFYGSKGEELYLNVDSGFLFGNRLKVITCQRESAGYNPLETLGALTEIIQEKGLPDDRWGHFCGGDA